MPAGNSPSMDSVAGDGAEKTSSMEMPSTDVIAYSVLTDGRLFPVSICEIMLAETPTSRARLRRLIPRRIRSARSRTPSHLTSDAGIRTSSVQPQYSRVKQPAHSCRGVLSAALSAA